MKLTDVYQAQLEEEAVRTRRVLQVTPEKRDDWKPHDKSMPLGRLATLVARMPSWFGFIVNQDELDVAPATGSNVNPPPLVTSAELVLAHDEAVQQAAQAFSRTTDDFLLTPWRLLAAGQVVMERPRHVVIRETFMHLAHHRAQLTVYLRMNGAPVPALYGPSADDPSFA
jgi:uncharacterized damage-inducible protein DinB